MQKVYLAGGFGGEWRSFIKSQSIGCEFVDPKDKEYMNGGRITMNVNEYGKWDLHFIKMSDIVFVYVDKANPSCIGLSCEAGFAKGIGKTVITVLEPNHETIKDSYLSFITQVSDVVFDNIDDGVEYLKSFWV